MIMTDGNKILARGIMTDVREQTVSHMCCVSHSGHVTNISLCFQTLELIKRKQVEKYHKAPEGKKQEIECNPYTIFHDALENCKPVVGLASIQKGGKYYQVCDEADQCSCCSEERKQSLNYFPLGPRLHPGAHPSFGQPAALPRHDMDD